ncbi:Mitogen-activated protein kinase kinase kinase 7 [Taenia solium]|eukprot:TsM_000324300 transcript=TsM_000324300 gene=TsM_000324300
MYSDKPVPKFSYSNCQKLANDELRLYKEKVKSISNIAESEIEIMKKSVSGGSFGDVSFGTFRGKNVVKKDFRHITTTNDRKYNYREAYTLATCNHQNIVKLIGAGPDTQIADVRYVVIERATNASLAELIHSAVKYSIWHVMLWNLHLADGLEYLHSRSEPIIHRDLKPANMLLFDGCTTLKISDFGCSKFFESGKEELQSVNQGSRLYMAPEVHQRRADENYTWYTEKVDIYSMTVSLWEMLTRTLDQNVNPYNTKISSCPPFLERLIARGMAPDPNQRPSALQLVNLLDFIMRKVYTENTSQLYIDFESGEIPCFYQQTPTYPVNSNADSSCASLSEEMATVKLVDPVSEVTYARISPADGQESPLYVTFDSPPCTRLQSERMDETMDFKEVPQLLRPILPTNRSEQAMKMYQRHVELAKEYIKLNQRLKRLKQKWDDGVTQIIAAKGIQPCEADKYKKRVTEYCELYVIMKETLRTLKFIKVASCEQLELPFSFMYYLYIPSFLK